MPWDTTERDAPSVRYRAKGWYIHPKTGERIEMDF